jgi:hypothetical protein
VEVAAVPDERAWVVFDRPDDQRQFEGVPEALAVRPVAAHGLRPPEGGPPVPAWPEPRPALVLLSPGVLGFVHPLVDASFAGRVARDWDRLRDLPPVGTADNYMRAPMPGADRPSASGVSWHPLLESDAVPDRGAFYEPLADTGRTALTLVNPAAMGNSEPIRCYQWSPTLSVREGTVMVLRYRARAEDGTGRVYVGMHHPVNLPDAEHGPAAERLRQTARPHPYLENRPGEDELDYQVADWVTPGLDWQTYYTVWEWPPFARGAAHRNAWVGYVGEGKVWIDQVEMFTWELPTTP